MGCGATVERSGNPMDSPPAPPPGGHSNLGGDDLDLGGIDDGLDLGELDFKLLSVVSSHPSSAGHCIRVVWVSSLMLRVTGGTHRSSC